MLVRLPFHSLRKLERNFEKKTICLFNFGTKGKHVIIKQLKEKDLSSYRSKLKSQFSSIKSE